MNAHNEPEQKTDKDKGGPPTFRLRVQTPRGLWSMTEPPNADRRPEYPISTKVQRVIDDARHVFGFNEPGSKYTLSHNNEALEPQRPLASYHFENDTLLVLAVQGGNA